MKKIYADLHLYANAKNLEQASEMIEKASELGYSLVAIPFPMVSEAESQRLKVACKETGLDLVSRVDLKPRSPDDLLQTLRRIRRKVEIIAVACESKSVARQAAKDRRVDILNFPSNDFRRTYFDFSEAELASNSLASLEVDVCPLLVLEGASRSKLLSVLRREAETARSFNVPIVLSSGASSKWLMRKPREIAAVASLFDVSRENSLKGVSTFPTAIVKRNREKLSSGFVAPGIRVVRRGRDC